VLSCGLQDAHFVSVGWASHPLATLSAVVP